MAGRGSADAARSCRVFAKGSVAPAKTSSCSTPPMSVWRRFQPVCVASGTASSGRTTPPISLPSPFTAATRVPYGAPVFGGASVMRRHAGAVFGAREVIDAPARTVLDVARPAGIGVDERRVAAVVLRGGIGVHHLEAGGRLDLERLEVAHRPRPVLAVLAEALVELAAHAAGDVGDDAVERLVLLLVVIQAVVDQRPQQASRLRAPVRVRPAHAHRRLAALEPRGAG